MERTIHEEYKLICNDVLEKRLKFFNRYQVRPNAVLIPTDEYFVLRNTPLFIKTNSEEDYIFGMLVIQTMGKTISCALVTEWGGESE